MRKLTIMLVDRSSFTFQVDNDFKIEAAWTRFVATPGFFNDAAGIWQNGAVTTLIPKDKVLFMLLEVEPNAAGPETKQ